MKEKKKNRDEKRDRNTERPKYDKAKIPNPPPKERQKGGATER